MIERTRPGVVNNYFDDLRDIITRKRSEGNNPQVIAGAILVNNAGKVLVVQQENKWGKKEWQCFIGGHVEDKDVKNASLSESIESTLLDKIIKTALLREVWEETNLNIPPNHACFLSMGELEDKNLIFVNYFIGVEGEPKIPLGEEISNYKWVTIEQAIGMRNLRENNKEELLKMVKTLLFLLPNVKK
jgi:8-oxo-dGTP pyrophosphatase MutT (NUDIX family)